MYIIHSPGGDLNMRFLKLYFLQLAVLAAHVSGNCTPDNLIRGLERHGGIPYCVLLLAPEATSTLPLPAEVATYAPEAISSAVRRVNSTLPEVFY